MKRKTALRSRLPSKRTNGSQGNLGAGNRVSRAGKKIKKPSTKTLKKKAWREFSIFIRTRDADDHGMVRCITCPTVAHWKLMQAGHFLRGRLNANLFDKRGCWAQCYACNIGRDGNVVEYYEVMLSTFGRETIKELKAQNQITHKWGPTELQAIYEFYKSLNDLNPLVHEKGGF